MNNNDNKYENNSNSEMNNNETNNNETNNNETNSYYADNSQITDQNNKVNDRDFMYEGYGETKNQVQSESSMNTEHNSSNYDNYEAADNNKQEVIYDTNWTSQGSTGGSSQPPKGNDRLKKFMQFTASALVFGIIAGVTFQGVNYAAGRIGGSNSNLVQNIGSIAEDEQKDDNNVSAVNTSSNQNNSDGDVSTIVENVMPSIVSIKSTAVNQVRDFFGRVYDNESTGSGSGIIIGQNKEEVLIVTNNHVIADASTVEITFDDGTTAQATVKGADSGADLAVVAVKVNELSNDTISNIKIANLGDSTVVKPGEIAIAIGNALGYGQSVTVGHISATEREVSIEDATMVLLQTDAAINPGNSGGALLNAKGEVIGINSVKYAAAEVEGIGYAIPISDAIPIITDLMNREIIPESEQAYMGIVPQTVTEEYSSRFNMPVGVYLYEVTKGSPADKAGLKEGDIIVEIDKRKVTTAESLQEIISSKKAGDEAVLTVQTLENGKYAENEIVITFGNK